MHKSKSSAEILSVNATRLSKIVPQSAKAKKLPVSTLRTATKGIKSPTLKTLDKLADTFDTPAWLLIHPDMKEWDQNRAWIERIVSAYINTSEEGRAAIRQTAITAELLPVKRAAPI